MTAWQRIRACTHSIALHLEFHWAEFRGDDIKALKIMKDIIMADYTKFDASLDRVAAQVAADAAAIDAFKAADANAQSEIDARTAKLDTIVPPPAAPEPAQVDQPEQ